MNYYRLGLAAAAALALAACDQPLNVDPTASIPADQAYRNAADLALDLRGAYDGLQYSQAANSSQGTYSRNLVVFPDLYADNLRFTGTFTTDQEVAVHNVATSNGAVQGIWASMYDAIGRANNVLAGIPNAKDLPAAQGATMRGEALFLRGLEYFDLVRFFGGVPILTEPTSTVTDRSLVSRASQAEVYRQIEKDLTEASGLLAPGGSPGRANRGAADALLARVYLEEGKWAQARDRATAVIDGGKYKLVESYADLFRTKNSPESIFELQYTANDQNSLAFWYFTRGLGGRWGFAPTDNLVAAFSKEDARLPVSIGKDAAGRLYGNKYTRISNSDDNVIVLRLADMYLTRAEANARLGASTAVVLADLNRVRQRAGLAPLAAPISPADLLDALLAERRREFAFEGQRFFDLRRFGKAQSVLNLSADRLLFPIPQREIDVNPKLQQNPGY